MGKATEQPAHLDAPVALFLTEYLGGSGASSSVGSGVDVIALARGLSMSLLGEQVPGAVIVIRTTPRPALGVVGRFDAATLRRLRTLEVQLADLRYVSYAQAEVDCELLADKLVESFGREELRRFRFTAIPRGGFIVLGMLAYVLGLKQAQLEAPHPPDAPLVVIDDCARSGDRFGYLLEGCSSPKVVFAHLYSHPHLRAAIEAREPSVLACLAAKDLRDHAPQRFGEEYAAWLERELAHREGPGYFIAQVDYVVFPWSEPTTIIRDPVTGRLERPWRIIPPDLCLKNRPTHKEERVPVRVQPEGCGPLRPSSRVLFGEFEGRIVIGDIETKESLSLTGVAADMWRAVVEHGHLEGAAAWLSRQYDVDYDTLQADLRDFVEDLLTRDLIEKGSDAGLDRRTAPETR